MKKVFGNQMIGNWSSGSLWLVPFQLQKRQEEFDWRENHPDVKKGYLGPYIKGTDTPLRYDEEA